MIETIKRNNAVSPKQLFLSNAVITHKIRNIHVRAELALLYL